MAKGYEFDRSSFSFRKATVSAWKIVLSALKYIAVTFSLTVVAYLLFALVVSTDTERRLRRENRMYEKAYPGLQPKEQLLGDVISGLQLKDNEIYGQVFHTDAPNVDPISSLDFLYGSDTIPDVEISRYATRKAMELELKAARVDSSFRRIFYLIAREGFVAPPMELPLKGISYPQVGASKGMRLNPFYKAYVEHNGMDFIVPQGTPVYAAADGEVVSVVHSTKGLGNMVQIAHRGGFKTNYAHLADIVVSKGQKISKGKKIGSVGMSGNTFAPHLHYEVMRDSVYLDPIGYIFASTTPDEYSNMLFMAVNTVQSMD